jgi:hypothetical protein
VVTTDMQCGDLVAVSDPFRREAGNTRPDCSEPKPAYDITASSKLGRKPGRRSFT